MQEELILEIVNNANCEPKMHRHSYLRSTSTGFSHSHGKKLMACGGDFTLIKKYLINIRMVQLALMASVVLCHQLLIIIGLTHVLVVCRVIATVLVAENSSWTVITENSQTVAVMLGAVLHYITITVMTRVNAPQPSHYL